MAAAAYWRQSLINNPFKSCNKQLTCFLFREILCSKVQEKCNTRRQTDRLLANHRKSYRETASKEADQSPWKLHRLFGKVLHGQTVWPHSSRIQSGSSNFENWKQQGSDFPSKDWCQMAIQWAPECDRQEIGRVFFRARLLPLGVDMVVTHWPVPKKTDGLRPKDQICVCSSQGNMQFRQSHSISGSWSIHLKIAQGA